MLLGRAREFAAAAHQLFHTGCLAVFGRSLKDEDPSLFNAVGKLFQHRNQIAHSGEAQVTADGLRADVTTARRAIAWVAEVSEG
jgi:hypothetical protein